LRPSAVGVCCISALLLLLAVGLMPAPSTVRADGYGSYPPPSSGDWVITMDTYVGNETIILNGNLTVQTGASLTLRNVTLLINSTSAVEYAIEVQAGATLRILDLDGNPATTNDATVIDRYDSSYTYFFRAYSGSTLEIKNSMIKRCGAATTIPIYAGPYIETDSALIEGNNFSYNYDGLVLYNSDALVRNNTFYWNEHTGIFAVWWSNATIENNHIIASGTYGIEISGWDNVDPHPSNPVVRNNVIEDTGRGTNTAVGIQVTWYSRPRIENTVILRSTEDGIYMGEGCQATIENVTIDGGNYGIASSTAGYVWINNTTIMNSIIADLSVADSFFILTNTTFNRSKVSVLNSGNLTVRWFLHVRVEDSAGTPIAGANVRVRDNSNGTYDENFTTGADGYVRWIVVTEYWQNSTAIINYTPHNISVSYSGLTFINNPREVWINNSRTESFTATAVVPELSVWSAAGAVVLVAVLAGRRAKKRSM